MDSFLIIGGKRGLSAELCRQITREKNSFLLVEKAMWSTASPKSLKPYLETFFGSTIIVCAHIGFDIGNVLDFIISQTPEQVDLIVVGSMVSKTQKPFYYPYYLEKKHYQEVVRQLQLSNRNRMIALAEPGLIDTDFVKDKLGNKMKCSAVAKSILETYETFKSKDINLISFSFTARD